MQGENGRVGASGWRGDGGRQSGEWWMVVEGLKAKQARGEAMCPAPRARDRSKEGWCEEMRLERLHAAARASVEGVAPQRLHWEAGAIHRDALNRALPRGDPGALVAVFGAAAIEPATVGVDVALGLAELVAADDGDAGLGAEAVEVGSAARSRVCDVGHVGEGDAAAEARGGRAMVRAILRAKAAGAVACGGVDHVLHVSVGAGGGVAEVRGRTHRFAAELALGRVRGRGAGIVEPDAAQDVERVGRVRARRAAGDGADGDTLAVLRHGVVPGAAADVVEEALLERGLTGGVVAVPLGAPVDEIDLVGASHDA